MNVDVGQVIAGKYELVRLLGKGAMGEVWLATHNSLGGEFAIKLVEPADDMEAETAAGRFQLEAQIAAKLSRKTRHIVSVSDHGEEDGLAYLVMELLEGESLEARTKRAGALALPEVAAIVLQVARALSLAHEEDIFHRDLKPANVWLGKDEDGRLLVKLLDFGIARTKKPFRTRSPFATSKDMVLGTPSYMSPEQARGLDTLDYRCDLWALAVVAYEALTKKIPFEGETVEDIFLSICTFRVVPVLARRADLPPALEAFFARAFAPKLEDRFTTALELSDAFERLVPAEELEQALGIVLTPSARRLEVARQSAPNLAAAPPSQPELSPPPPSSDPMAGMRSSSPDLNVAVGGPTVITRRRGGGGLFIAITVLMSIVGIGAVILVAMSRSDKTPTTKQPDPPTSAIATVTTATTTLEDIPPPEPAPSPSPPPASSPAAVRPVVATGAPKPPAPAPPPVTSPTPAPHTSPSPAKSAPAPAKSVDKANVF
ncbi:MAG: serine/threonine protein kinase [Labilithrix sp.]|nr:serine/threonine protein kinase [Labilithrix sp.]